MIMSPRWLMALKSEKPSRVCVYMCPKRRQRASYVCVSSSLYKSKCCAHYALYILSQEKKTCTTILYFGRGVIEKLPRLWSVALGCSPVQIDLIRSATEKFTSTDILFPKTTTSKWKKDYILKTRRFNYAV